MRSLLHLGDILNCTLSSELMLPDVSAKSQARNAVIIEVLKKGDFFFWMCFLVNAQDLGADPEIHCFKRLAKAL